MDVLELSRLQFAITALYHFLFVPLTLGLAVMLFIMESVWVMTGRPIWRTITRFWGTLFGINFVLGVATGLTMEFEFGTNWAYYSQYVGDVFGAPLAIEGLMAFFLEATFVGLMFFGWEKLSRPVHLLVTGLVALGTNLSALWILVANGWMQNPVGAKFNPQTLRMEVTSFRDVLFNPVAQDKFVHVVSAGYVTAAVFVMGVSALMLLRNKWPKAAKRSFAVAAAFGLAASLSVVVLGDESGYTLGDSQKMKLAALESMWKTEPAPAPITAIGLPDPKARTTRFAIQVPYVLGLIATRSFDTPVLGIEDLVGEAHRRIETGVKAYDAEMRLRADPNDVQARAAFDLYGKDYGYALLLKRYVNDPRQASPALIDKAAWSTVPNVTAMFFLFRTMVVVGFFQIAVFAWAFLAASTNKVVRSRWLLRTAVFMLPLPWLAIETGWLLSEIGRQPWVVAGVLPTFLGTSSLSVGEVWASLIGFIALYSLLAVIEVGLIIRTIRRGPYAVHEPLLEVGGGVSPLPAPAE